jgi:hypothetical protein
MSYTVLPYLCSVSEEFVPGNQPDLFMQRDEFSANSILGNSEGMRRPQAIYDILYPRSALP